MSLARRSNRKNIAAYSVLFSFLPLLCGCIIFPYTTPRSAEVTGRVLDANTRLPIKGADVYLIEEPHHTTHTDANGYFRLKATHNFHLIYAGDGCWPNNKTGDVQISCTGYQLSGVNGYIGGNVLILLTPIKK